MWVVLDLALAFRVPDLGNRDAKQGVHDCEEQREMGVVPGQGERVLAWNVGASMQVEGDTRFVLTARFTLGRRALDHTDNGSCFRHPFIHGSTYYLKV
jgi:hypothetical protein